MSCKNNWKSYRIRQKVYGSIQCELDTLYTNTIQQPTPAASAWVENSAKAASLWKSSEVLLTNGYYKIPLYI